MTAHQQLRIINELKVELFKHFEDIQFEIDIDVQEQLAQLDTADESKRKHLLFINENMISQVNEALKANVALLNEYKVEKGSRVENEHDFKENLKAKLLNKSCFYAKSFEANKMLPKVNLPHGFLLTADWYLDKNQLAYLRSRIEGTIVLIENTLTENMQQRINHTNILDINSDFLLIYYTIYRLNYFPEDFKFDYIIKLEKKNIIEKLNKLDYFHMELDYFTLINIQQNTFEHLSNIESLIVWVRLNNFHISLKLDDDAFNGLSNLKILKLKAKNIITLANTFRHLNKLKELVIFRKYFDPDVFNGLSDLNKLTLFTQCPPIDYDGLNDLINLNELELTLFDTKVLTKKIFKGLNNLKYLTIDLKDQPNAQVIKIDEDVFDDLTSLKFLSIELDKLQVLSTKLLKNLKQLEVLYIYSNYLGEIQRDAFKELKYLKSISLRTYGQHCTSEQVNYLSNLTNAMLKSYFDISNKQDIRICIKTT